MHTHDTGRHSRRFKHVGHRLKLCCETFVTIHDVKQIGHEYPTLYWAVGSICEDDFFLFFLPKKDFSTVKFSC